MKNAIKKELATNREVLLEKMGEVFKYAEIQSRTSGPEDEGSQVKTEKLIFIKRHLVPKK